MDKNTKPFTACLTCLSLSETDFPVTDDIKRMLRILLYDFDIDGFFRLKPPEKRLKLCRKCNNIFRDIFAFKERVTKSFNELKKYWCFDREKTMKNTITALSSSRTVNVTPLHVKKIDPTESKYGEPDPLEINVRNPEDTENVINIEEKNNIINITEETDNVDITEETNMNNRNEFYEQEPLNTDKNGQEQAIEDNNNAKTLQNENQTNNKKEKLTNELLDHNIAPTYNSVKQRNNLVINKVTASNTNKNSSNSELVKRLIVFPGSNNYVVTKLTPTAMCKISSNINRNLQNHNVAVPRNDKLNQNTAGRVIDVATLKKKINLNGGNDNSNASNAATGINDLENVIQSNLLLKKGDRLKPTIAIATTNNGHSRTIDVSHIPMNNTAVITNPYNLVTDKSQPSIANTCGVNPTGRELNPYAATTQNTSNDVRPNIDEDDSQKKWYIKLVSREEILKNMEEKRNNPAFLNAPYKCVSCVSVFNDEQLLETHKKSCHTEVSEFTCFACLSTFKSFNKLNAHYYVHIKEICVYYCITCAFDTKYIDYMKDHSCPNAGRKILPPKDPKTMKLTRFKSCYYCPKCKYMSPRGSGVVLHYNQRHKESPKTKCGECGKFYRCLKEHVNTVHRGFKKPPGDPVYCSLCHKWYSGKTSYKIHMGYKHSTKEKKFGCDECGKKFLTSKALDGHKEYHEAIKKGRIHKCDVCGKAYYTPKGLRGHVLNRHEKPRTTRDHVCEVCGMAFFTRMMLKSHSARHSDERPYTCSHCGDTFKYTGVLRTHMKLKHEKKKTEEESPKTKRSTESAKEKGEKKRELKKKKGVKRKRKESSSTEEELLGFAEKRRTGQFGYAEKRSTEELLAFAEIKCSEEQLGFAEVRSTEQWSAEELLGLAGEKSAEELLGFSSES